MAFKINYEKKNLKLENAYLKIREIVIQDSGVVILKYSVYKKEEDRKKDINATINNDVIYLTEKDAIISLGNIFKQGYKILKDKIESDKDNKCKDLKEI